jgi:hypothetical protein
MLKDIDFLIEGLSLDLGVTAGVSLAEDLSFLLTVTVLPAIYF